jgi:hypothetical protein
MSSSKFGSGSAYFIYGKLVSGDSGQSRRAAAATAAVIARGSSSSRRSPCCMASW